MTREGGEIIEYQGRYRTVVWVPDSAGRLRGREYYEALPIKDRAKFRALIERLSDFPEGIRDTTKFRNEGDGIWALKRYQDRLFCYMDGRRVCITHGMKKKKDRVPPKELEVAKAIRDDNKTRRD